MDKNQKLQVSKALLSDDDDVILEALTQIREHDQVDMMPQVVDVLKRNVSSDVTKKIVLMLLDSQDNKLVPIITDALANNDFAGNRYTLLSVCWQSPLDFGAHLPLFIDLFISEPFINAFEAYTVVQNLPRYNLNVARQQIERLKASTNLDAQKHSLRDDIIQTLENAE